MTEQTKGFTDSIKDPAADAVALLTHYSFDLRQNTATALVDKWLTEYKPGWIRFAVIEALYQGRYKAISVEQILVLWQRRGQILHHFNHEFERLVCNKLPRSLTQPAGTESDDPQSAAIATFLKRLHQDINRNSDTNITEDSPASSRSLPPTELSNTIPQPLESESPLELVDDSGVADLNELPSSAPPEPDETITSPTTIAAPEEVDPLTAVPHRAPTLFPTPSEAAEVVVDDTPILRPNPGRSSTAALMPEVEAASDQPPGTSELEGNTPDATSEVVANSTSITDFTATEISQHNSVETTALASVHSINQFTPVSESSEFHAKLRAVAHVDELSS
jgi:hypothetical protein